MCPPSKRAGEQAAQLYDGDKNQTSKYNYVTYYFHVLKSDFDSGNTEDKQANTENCQKQVILIEEQSHPTGIMALSPEKKSEKMCELFKSQEGKSQRPRNS